MTKIKTIDARPLSTLSFGDEKLYLLAALFTAGNVVAPTVVHEFYSAGHVLLPIYFFSLLGGLVYGWRAGLVIGLLSPLVSYAITQMPPAPIIGFVVLKSILLGFVSGWLHQNTKIKNVWLIALLTIVVTQLIGSLYIYLVTKNSMPALFDLKVGYPGLLLQLIAAPAIAYFWLGNAKKAD